MDTKIKNEAVFDPSAFRRVRKRSGFSQARLAGGIGLSAQAINQWERIVGGTLPDLVNLIKTANLLKCSVDELLGRKESKVIAYRGYELITAWEKLPSDWQDRIYYFVTTFGLLKRVSDAESNFPPPPRRPKRNPPKKR